MDVGNATIIAAAIAAAVSLGSSVFAWCAANKSNKAAAQSNEVTNRTNREIAVFEQDEENKRNESQIDANIVWSARVEWIQNVRSLHPRKNCWTNLWQNIRILNNWSGTAIMITSKS